MLEEECEDIIVQFVVGEPAIVGGEGEAGEVGEELVGWLVIPPPGFGRAGLVETGSPPQV
jgi:hypothetical protein